jgi:hypothetical protein
VVRGQAHDAAAVRHLGGQEVKVEGGNHRAAVADAAGVRRIPAYVDRKNLADFLRLVPGAVPIPDAVIDDPGAWDGCC